MEDEGGSEGISRGCYSDVTSISRRLIKLVCDGDKDEWRGRLVEVWKVGGE